MPRFICRSSRHGLLMAVLALLFVSCASDPSGPAPKADEDPGPVVLEDGHVFRVFTIESGGKAPRLRWVGDGDGPFAESPEATPEPWIGFGRPFRIEWEVTSEAGRVTGYQFRFNHEDETPFFPRAGGEAVYGDVDALDFINESPVDEVDPACFNDPDCFRTIQLPSGVYPLEIRALDETGRERTEPQFQIRFHSNYEPIAVLQDDEIAGCDEPEHFPRYVFSPAVGEAVDCALLSGETIPLGSAVRLRLDGLDRLDDADFPDGRCCDERNDPAVPELRYQALLEITAQTDRGFDENWFTFFGEPTETPELEFTTGPFDYRIVGQSVDEHERRSEPVGFFDFRSGSDPEILSVEPSDGATIHLRNPLDGEWPSNEVGYEVVIETRYWDPAARRVLRFPGDGRESMAGHVFRLPLRFEGRASPNDPPPLQPNSTIQGGVLAWAYEWISEFDPENVIQEGPAFDDLGEFSESPLPNLWVIDGEGTVEFWIPLDLWLRPERYLDGQNPNSKEELMAAELLRHLGVIDYLVRGRSSWSAIVERCPPMTPEQLSSPEGRSRCLPEQALRNVGRYSSTSVQQLELRLGLDRGGSGSLTELWPAPSAKRAARLSEAAILRRIRTPRANG